MTIIIISFKGGLFPFSSPLISIVKKIQRGTQTGQRSPIIFAFKLLGDPMKLEKQYDDKPWKMKVQFANNLFNNGDKASSARHYQTAIYIATQLFVEFKNTTPLPDALTPVLVVSYLNLADCWAGQSKKKEQILCLIEIYDILKSGLTDHSISQALKRQMLDGISKIYLELCLCFKAIDAQKELLKTQEDYTELSSLYQIGSCTVH